MMAFLSWLFYDGFFMILFVMDFLMVLLVVVFLMIFLWFLLHFKHVSVNNLSLKL